MKYTKLSNNLKNFVIGAFFVIMILLIIGLAGVFLWLDLSYPFPMLSLFWLLLLPTAGLAINWYIGRFFGDEYSNTDFVVEGRTVKDVVKTPKYYTRKMVVCFVECFLFVLIIVRFIFLFPFGIATSIIGIIGAIVGIAIYFIVGMSSYEQSSIKNKKTQNTNVEEIKTDEEEIIFNEPIGKKRKPTKFNFNNYPELLEKYNSFNFYNSKKYKTLNNTKEQDNDLNELNNAFEILALAIYNTFNPIKPELIIKQTGEKINWEDVINKPFEELSYMEKTILVRLLDRLYKYVLPNNYYNL